MLTEEFIKKQKQENQEVCNQLNRRTEFSVLRTTYGLFDDKGQLKKQPETKSKPQKPDLDDSDIFIGN